MRQSSWSGARFVAMNVWCARRFPPDRTINHLPDHLLLRTMTAPDIDAFESLHNRLRPEKLLSSWRRWLYARLGPKLVWTVQTDSGDLVAFNMYYFREDEWDRDIVHEAFIGVAAEYRGRMLSSAMRASAIEHFTKAGLHAISTHIDRGNVPSWRSAVSQGFQEVPDSTSERILLLRRLAERGR